MWDARVIAGIPVFFRGIKNEDGRDKPGHDER
jgi:hypothetical protein